MEGAIGSRGPGETQLETDRRLIRDQIKRLKKDLERVRTHRHEQRQQRDRAGIPLVALVGYTNAGKSTLMNALTAAKVPTRNRLFETLDPTTRRCRLDEVHTVLLSDTVGFIQKLPTQLVAAFRATLEELLEADLLLHVVDATHPDAAEQAVAVHATLAELGVDTRPTITVLNKIDLLEGAAPVDLRWCPGVGRNRRESRCVESLDLADHSDFADYPGRQWPGAQWGFRLAAPLCHSSPPAKRGERGFVGSPAGLLREEMGSGRLRRQGAGGGLQAGRSGVA